MIFPFAELIRKYPDICSLLDIQQKLGGLMDREKCNKAATERY